MENKKKKIFFDNTPNQLSKFRMKNWVGVNNDLCEMYSEDSQIEFKISMLRSSLCVYRDAYILVKETMTVPNTEVEDANQNNRNKTVIFKNCAPLTDCISEISNTEVVMLKVLM